MKRQFAISDIHGCKRSFEALLDRIAFTQSDELFLLGDYIDRGPDSKGVLDTIFQLQENGYAIRCLRGNHDQMLLNALDDFSYVDHWTVNGGSIALESFGCRRPEEIPGKYIHFLREMPLFILTEGYVLVHGGLNFKYPDPLYDTSAMMWIRHWYDQIDHSWLRGRTILHGHTPMSRDAIQVQYEHLDTQGYLDIDCGCCYTGPVYARTGLGFLCAFDMTNRAIHFQPNCEVSSADAGGR